MGISLLAIRAGDLAAGSVVDKRAAYPHSLDIPGSHP
jgi:hypothetical protein